MSRETDFLDMLRALPLHAGARGLADDAAVLEDAGNLVLTQDTLVAGVHFLADDPPASIAWRAIAVNLSDLAAKGAAPAGVLLSYSLGRDAAWDRAFVAGLGEALEEMEVPLLGGDTVSVPGDGARSYTVTAIGRAPLAGAPSREGARAGDSLWVTGTIGDAGAGLAIACGGEGPDGLLARYRYPRPRTAEGQSIATHANATMDVSDGLLIDARRMAAASGVAVSIDLARLPLSAEFVQHTGGGPDARMAAATSGDDYELLFALPSNATPPVVATRIGEFLEGSGISVTMGAVPTELPDELGYEHH